MQAKREKNHNNSNHAPISTFTHNKIRSLSPVLAAPQPLAATGFEAIENARTMRNGKKRSRPKALPHKDINRIPFMSKARGHQKIW